MTWMESNKHRSGVANRLGMLSWSVEHYRPSATISGPVQPWPSFLISSNQISGSSMCMTWLGTMHENHQTRVKCCQLISNPNLVCRTLSAQCNDQRPSATMAKIPYFQLLDLGFKHVYDKDGSQQTRVRCCQSIRHAFLVCRTLSAQCNHQRPIATVAKFPYFQQFDIGLRHVYDMVGTHQTRVTCCQSITHADLVCRTLSAQCNHLRPSATMAEFPFFQSVDIGFKCMTQLGPSNYVSSVVDRLEMLTWSVEHYRPNAIICGPVQLWPSFLISSNQI